MWHQIVSVATGAGLYPFWAAALLSAGMWHSAGLKSAASCMENLMSLFFRQSGRWSDLDFCSSCTGWKPFKKYIFKAIEWTGLTSALRSPMVSMGWGGENLPWTVTVKWSDWFEIRSQAHFQCGSTWCWTFPHTQEFPSCSYVALVQGT